MEPSAQVMEAACEKPAALPARALLWQVLWQVRLRDPRILFAEELPSELPWQPGRPEAPQKGRPGE